MLRCRGGPNARDLRHTRVAAAEGADYTPAVSDHTERIDGLVERVSAAKEFL
jgi:hypothetical protein